MTTSVPFPIAAGTKVRWKQNAALEGLQILVVGAHTRTYYTPQSLVCTDTSVHSLTVPPGATHADIVMEGAASTDYVRFWYGATDPTATVGIILLDGQLEPSADPATFTAIKGSTGGGGTLRISYYSYE